MDSRKPLSKFRLGERMIPLLTGTSAYLLAGILSMTYPRYRFWFSLMGWAGALAGLARGVFLYATRGDLVTTLGEWGVLGIEIKIDQTTLLFAALVVLLNLFTLMYLGEKKQRDYFILYNFLFATSFSLAFSNDLFNIYVSIELISLISILLIGYERKAYQIYAGIKYLVLSSLAMSLYLIGLGLVYRIGGHLGIDQLLGAFNDDPSFSLYIGLGLMVTGLAVKGGVFLFSMWLPDAYTYSGTVTSALLAGIGTKSGLIGIIRISALASMNNLLIWLGIMTGIVAAVFAVISSRPRRILAFSSISQMGYILIGVGLGTPAGILAASLHIFFHGLFKGLLFLSVGHAGVGGKDIYKDKISSVPLSSKLGLIVGSLSIMAIPPFNVYFSKTLLLEEAGHGWAWWAILVIGLGTVVYSLELNRALLAGTSTEGFRINDLPILGFTLFVALSGVIGWVILGGREIIGLMVPHHLAVTFALVPAGGLVLLISWRKLKELEMPASLFNMDTAVISIFTGFLFVISALLLG